MKKMITLMMSKLTKLNNLFYLSILFFFSINIFAETYNINSDHSAINFKIKYMMLSDVPGTFQKFSGTMEFDPKTKKLGEIIIEISSKSVFTSNKLRDNHLKKKDFFDVQKYPYISFRSTKIEQDNDVYTVHGNLTIKDITQSVVLAVEYLGEKKDTWGNQSTFFKFYTDISRNEFQLLWNKTLDNGEYLLGENVEVFGSIQTQADGNRTASSKHLIPDTKQIRLREKLSRNEITEDELPKLTEKTDIKEINKKTVLKKEYQKNYINSYEDEKITNDNDGFPRALSIIILGLFAFIGSCFLAYHAKLFITKIFEKEAHSELSVPSLLGDFAAIAIVFAYAYSFFVFFG